ncbi:hypothetical protein C5L14_24185 [Labrys okinawensis]|uniref:Uncharacterized protein n=1 Tax=Labrys okinawensis TaxID=346911 RepID=A0A2S9Q6Q3_9HYPH|nr:hypothetical protein C5L14_24185 [Labrys okinawensis]
MTEAYAPAGKYVIRARCNARGDTMYSAIMLAFSRQGLAKPASPVTKETLNSVQLRMTRSRNRVAACLFLL